MCLVAISLAKGGAERSTALLSQMLASKGYEVHIVILNDEVDYPYAGVLYNMGLYKNRKNALNSRTLRFIKLRSYLKKQHFDIVIDNRTRSSSGKELFYLNYLYRGFKVVYVIRSGELSEYLPSNEKVASQMIEKAYKVVAVSKQIAETVNQRYHTSKVQHIYNPMPDHSDAVAGIQEDHFIIFIGRIVDKVKNISLLLQAYQLSVLPKENIKLKIFGDGEDRDRLIQYSEQLNISEMVEFFSFQAHVFPYLKAAKFTVLTSRYEGFPRALIESLSVGTPVVSVDCISGPSEIVQHEQNGLLVKNHEPKAFAKAMDRMVLDTELYERCKKNSYNSVAHLSLNQIAEEWDKLLQNER